MKRRVLGAFFTALLLTTTGLSMFAMLPEVPIDRLIRNTTAYIKEHPDDAMGPYTLARVHYLALAKRAPKLGTIERGAEELPLVEHRFGNLASFGDGAARGKLPGSTLEGHVKAAVENYQKAIAMETTNPLFHLGLASVSEAVLTSGIKLGAIPGVAAPRDGDFKALWREQAIAEYLRAYELGVSVESASRREPLGGLNSLVSYEAGQRYATMVQARGPRGREPEILKMVQAALTAFDNLEPGAVTPILFALDAAVPLRDLLDPHRVVKFNMDGTGRPQRYRWVRPNTGILVWDPDNSGKITSGHQLFGSVSFNMFWSDGYRALDGLDDNRDGSITGTELTGLAVWFDRNQDGVSEAGEVVPINRTGIAALSVRWTERVDASLVSSRGLVTDRGRVLPTYDWITSPIPEKPSASSPVPVS